MTTVGTRTAGAGGAAGGTLAGVYSEAEVALTIALGYRSKSIVSDDLPTAALIENIGIRPDIALELMTAENLANKGRPYLDRYWRLRRRRSRCAVGRNGYWQHLVTSH